MIGYRYEQLTFDVTYQMIASNQPITDRFSKLYVHFVMRVCVSYVIICYR